MDYTLAYHPDRYKISSKDAFFSSITAFSGVTYANRHMEMAEIDPEHALGHKVIGLVEYIPVLGALVALIERVANSLFFNAPPPLVRNMIKAVVEHRMKDSKAYVTISKAIPSLKELNGVEDRELKFSHTIAADIGVRPLMEDAHFYKEIEQGVLTGLFDGHAGKDVSAYANSVFEKEFSQILKDSKGDVRKAFETTINKIHNSLTIADQGSTAVVCFIDKKTHQIYTATLGDSEANIYREIDGKIGSIPLSCVRDWTSRKDYNRLLKATKPEFLRWIKDHKGQAKKLRALVSIEKRIKGVNVARAIGDKLFKAVIQKPKITVNKIKPGDRLVIACDGLKDYVDESSIVDIIKSRPENLASALVLKAGGPKALDNVTVIAVAVA